MTIEKPQLFFENFAGTENFAFLRLPQSGSARINFVGEADGKKYIITANENLAENETFLYLSDIFSKLQLNTPTILKVDPDRKIYIQEYLGSSTLSQILEKEGLNEHTENLVKKSLRHLFKLQQKTTGKIDYSKTFEYEEYNELPITNDLFYFKNFVADVLELPYHKSTLLKEFANLTEKIKVLQPKGIMIRDFQARNIMVDENDEVYFIDYQSAMLGPLMYDVISFLFQAKANFPEEFKAKMLDYYFSLWSGEQEVLALKNSVQFLQLIRFMQVLGAYGFRGLFQKKPHFISSMEQGIKNLHQFSQNWTEMDEYPELKKLISEIASEQTQQKIENIVKN